MGHRHDSRAAAARAQSGARRAPCSTLPMRRDRVAQRGTRVTECTRRRGSCKTRLAVRRARGVRSCRGASSPTRARAATTRNATGRRRDAALLQPPPDSHACGDESVSQGPHGPRALGLHDRRRQRRHHGTPRPRARARTPPPRPRPTPATAECTRVTTRRRARHGRRGGRDRGGNGVRRARAPHQRAPVVVGHEQPRAMLAAAAASACVSASVGATNPGMSDCATSAPPPPVTDKPAAVKSPGGD